MCNCMEDKQFDEALVAAVFSQAALRGWADVNIADAARDAGLPLDRVRARFPSRGAVLLRFGVLADQAALGAGSVEPGPRERLFDMVMSRFDALQQHRAGVLQLLRALRTDPATSLLLYGATLRSMKWLLDAAGVSSTGLVGALRVHGLLALWLYGVRAWENDESADLSATMAAVDRGLDRAIQAENMLPGRPQADDDIIVDSAGVDSTVVGGSDADSPLVDSTGPDDAGDTTPDDTPPASMPTEPKPSEPPPPVS